MPRRNRRKRRRAPYPVWIKYVVISVGLAILLNWFLHTDLGLAVRATGSNPAMAESLGMRTDNLKVLGLMLANGLVALSGA